MLTPTRREHLPAMQVRGLDLRLDRLRTASLAFFGRAMADDAVRTHLATAVAGAADLSLTAAMFSRAGIHGAGRG